MVAGRTYCALISAALCCGCMLIVPRGDETFRVDKPVLSADRARYVASDPAGEFPVATKDQVLAAWGKPDAIEPPQVIEEQTTNQGKEPAKDTRMRGVLLWGKADTGEMPKGRNERWIYKDGRRWKGTWLWILIVPLPLLYPTTNQLAVEYSGESAVAIETVNTSHGSMTFCGLYWFLIPMCLPGGKLESDKARFVSTHQLLPPNPQVGTVSTLAGTAGTVGSTDGTGAAASFNFPVGVATDSEGNIYVADTNNNTIRKITSAGVVTTLAGTAGNVGSADGTGAAASFSSPRGVAVDRAGNVYVADTYNDTIRKITPGGVVSTLAGTAGNVGSADGKAAAASFKFPAGVATDGAGNVYVADTDNGTIRKITPAGVVTTLAGTAGNVGSADGTGAAASFSGPRGVAVDTAGNVYVADTYNHAIRKITPRGVVSMLTAKAAFNQPSSVAIDAAGDVYVSDDYDNAIRRIALGGDVSTLAGPLVAGLRSPGGVATDSGGNVYVADTSNNTIRKIVPAAPARLDPGASGMVVTAASNTVAVVENLVRRISRR
jgi:streptogramin lyase